MRQIFILVVLFISTTSTAFGTVIASHIGANDPVTEGWTLKDESGGQNIYGPVYNDLGHTNAWRLDSATNHAHGDLEYEWWLSEAQVTEAQTKGWALNGKIRLIEASYRGIFVFRFSTGAGLYQISLSGTPSSDPTILVGNGPSVTLNGGGGVYHQYRIADENADGAADVYIDGALVFSNCLSIEPLYTKRIVEFGDVQDNTVDNGHALFSDITFEIVPEPTTALLLAIAGTFVYRRRNTYCCEREERI